MHVILSAVHLFLGKGTYVRKADGCAGGAGAERGRYRDIARAITTRWISFVPS